jgi:hypothetical protein
LRAFDLDASMTVDTLALRVVAEALEATIGQCAVTEHVCMDLQDLFRTQQKAKVVSSTTTSKHRTSYTLNSGRFHQQYAMIWSVPGYGATPQEAAVIYAATVAGFREPWPC